MENIIRKKDKSQASKKQPPSQGIGCFLISNQKTKANRCCTVTPSLYLIIVFLYLLVNKILITEFLNP